MPETATLGPYGVTLEQRGVRLSREGEQRVSAMGAGLRAVLAFSLTESGEQPVLFQLKRMDETKDGGLEIQGVTTEHVALYATLQYREETDALEADIQVVNATEEMTTRLGVHLDLIGQADPRWLIPGLFYNENRVRDCKRMYPAWSEIQRDPGRFLTNHWNFRSDRTAMPVVFCMTYVLTAFMFTEEIFGQSADRPQGQGISAVGMSADDGFPRISAHAPYLEDPVKFSYCHEHKTQPEETFVRLEKNEPLRFRTVLGFLPFDGEAEQPWDPVYRELQRELWMNHAQRPKLSSIETERLALKGLMRWHYDEKNAMIHESSAFDKHYGRHGHNYERTHMHCGWLSGALPAYVLLWNGRETMTPEYVQAGTAVLDRMTAELAPCGTLWPLITLEAGNLPGLGPEDGLAHSRTIAEAVLFLIRAFRLELEANTAHRPWFDAVRSSLNFILTKQREDGAFPAYWFVDDGEVFSYSGTAGMCWIAALAAYDSVVSSDVYKRAARRAAEYYSQFVEADFLYGCVEDLPLVPTVDDAHWATISYTILYECDRDERWLDVARRSANLAFTWRMTYNESFQPFSMLARARFQTRGGDISSAAAPALTPTGVISLAEMRKLSALTGDPYFEQRALEGRLYISQLLARADGEFNARIGHALHQVYHTDWWQPKGMILSQGHAITCALAIYAEMIERTLVIPTAAMTGNRESIMDAVSRSGLTLRETNIVMPESAEGRRKRDTRGDWEEDQPYQTPAEAVAGGTLAAPKAKPPTRIIGSAARAVNFTPLPWESGPESGVFGTPKQTSQKPGPRSADTPKSLDELPRKQFARQSASDPPQLAKGGAWEILSQPDESSDTPMPDDGRKRGVHTPLSDNAYDLAQSRDLLKKPLLDPTGSDEKVRKPPEQPSRSELATPPPGFSEGLLANLFDEDASPRATPLPLEDPETAKMKFSLDSEAEEDEPAPDPREGTQEDAEEEGEGSDIRWKIF